MSYYTFTHNLKYYIESSYETFDIAFLSLTENIWLINSNHPRAPINIYTSTNFAFQLENLTFNP